MSDWEPIETAPKNARAILICDGNSSKPEAVLGHFNGMKWICCSADDYARDNLPGVMPYPTHWRRLPEPPK